MANSGSMPCRTQGDLERLSFTVKMESTDVQYHSTFKMAHYKYARIKWLSFKNLTPGTHILHLYVNSLGDGRCDLTQNTNASTVGTPMPYFFSTPIEDNKLVAYSSGSDPWRWVTLPTDANLRNIQFYIFSEGETAGALLTTFVTPANPCCFELEFACSI